MTGKKLIKLASDDDDDEKFPSLLDDIQEYFGKEVLDRLVDACGGIRVIISSVANLTEDAVFSKAVGFETALAISDMLIPAECAGIEVKVPLRHTQSIIKLQDRISEMLVAGGYSSRFIALTCGVNERTVWRQRARLKRAGVQLGDSATQKQGKTLELDPEVQRLISTLLLEGFAPSLLRQHLRVGGGFITKIRNRLIQEGKLTC